MRFGGDFNAPSSIKHRQPPRTAEARVSGVQAKEVRAKNKLSREAPNDKAVW